MSGRPRHLRRGLQTDCHQKLNSFNIRRFESSVSPFAINTCLLRHFASFRGSAVPAPLFCGLQTLARVSVDIDFSTLIFLSRSVLRLIVTTRSVIRIVWWSQWKPLASEGGRRLLMGWALARSGSEVGLKSITCYSPFLFSFSFFGLPRFLYALCHALV